MKKLLATALAAMAASGAIGKDLGVQGNTFPIIETDMRQLFRMQLEKLDVPAIQDQVKTAGKRYLDTLPKRSLPTPERTGTAYVDLSFTLSSAIQSPVRQPDGTWKWQVLYPAGTKVNPLEKNRPLNAMLFIDGAQRDQVLFAKRMVQLLGRRVYVLEAGQGSINDDNDVIGTGVYHGDDKLMARFQITQLPSLLYPGEGANAAFMAVTSFARPFKAEDGAGWSVLKSKLPPSKVESK